MRKFLILPILLVVQLATADFTGEWELKQDGETIRLSLKQTGSTLTGSSESDGLAISIEGTVTGNEAKGDFKVKGLDEKLKFRAKLNGDKMTFSVAQDDKFEDAETLEFTRVTKTTSPTETKTSVVSKFKTAPSATLRNGKEYQHASGGKFRYPADWELTVGEEGLRLTPPDAAANEFYLILGEPAQGATDPATPEILAYLDSQVTGVFPTLKRAGKVETGAAGGGKAAIITWDGKHEGADYRVRSFTTIMKGFGVSLVAAGPKAKVEARDAQLREIFQTFGWGEGKVDPQLVGTWNHWSYSGSTNYGREEKAQIVLNQDGTFTYRGESETAMSAEGRNAGGEQTWVGGANARRGSGWQGRWTADGKTIILNFEDGTSEIFTYGFKQEGANVFLVATPDGGGKATEWSRG